MPRPLALLAALAITTAACGDDDDTSGEVTVFAAASLTDAFTDIGDAFTAANPDADVTYSFASSSDLVTQINEGAPADVYASADQSNMAKLTDAGNSRGEPEVFATNTLEIIVEPGNPKGIAGVADLADPELVVVTCDPEVPIGRYSAEVFANAGVTVEPDSFEEDVKAVVNKVVLGEADAGVVYATDVTAAGDGAEGVEIPDDVNVTADYPIAVTADAPSPAGASAFVEFVTSDAGQDILRRHGFSPP
jgi:molybdate transport system substrate-binding protein